MGADYSEVKKQFFDKLHKIVDLRSLESLRNDYLGRKGIINSLTANLKNLTSDEKQTNGRQINELKNFVSGELKIREEDLIKKSEKKEYIDVTLPGIKKNIGSLHLVTQAIEEISQIFKKLGFVRLEYREVEWEYFSFEALNMPKGHPARDDFETFFIEASENAKYGKMVLTPHTSSGQIREMQRVKGSLPIKMINIGKCYRPNWDATHTPMFHQFEGLCIDRAVNIANLKGTIDFFAKEFFGEKRRIRLRPFHFQFTEPSFEVDITCNICNSKGEIEGVKCKVCKAGWLELGGAGMVHPNVLKSGGIDPEKYSGWAFGFGIERVALMKEGLELDDIRILYKGDIRFLEQL